MRTQAARRPAADDLPPLSIERVEVFGVAVPLVGPGFKNAYLTKTVQKSALVRITASGGAIGLGNIDPSPGYSAESIEASLAALREQLAPCVQGLDAANIHRLNARLDAAVSGFLDAKAAIEMACVDLTARALGIPVHAYLGGAVKDRLTFNAWIGIVSPQEAAAEACKWFERGFRSAKIKFGGGIAADRERVRAAREAVGSGMALRIDANAGYDAETAIRLLRLVEPFELQLFEQPVPAEDLAGMARVRREAGGIPSHGGDARHGAGRGHPLRDRARVRPRREHDGRDHARRHQRERDRRARVRRTAQDRGRYRRREDRSGLRRASASAGAGFGRCARRGEACALPLCITAFSRHCSLLRCSPRRRRSLKAIPRAQCGCWCPSRPAERPTSSRASSARGSPKIWGSPCWWRTAAAPAERSPPPCSPSRRPTAIR